jgi:DNA-binding beta-propeller fold protein YncE
MLTAGHCTGQNTYWEALNVESLNKATVEEIGWVEQEQDQPGDWAKIKANGSFWDTPDWPTWIAKWGEDESWAIGAEAASYVGQWVCHTGQYRSRCAPVIAHNVNTPNTGREHLTMTGSDCAEQGDSGGAFYADRVALGIVSSRVLPVPPCGEMNILYAEITEAADAMGVWVGPRLGSPPEAITQGVCCIAPFRATLQGLVAPHGIQTDYYFRFGETSAFGQSTSWQNAGSGWGKSSVSAVATGLKGRTTYVYELIAKNAGGTSEGYEQEFTTPDWRPIIADLPTTNRAVDGATLNATIDPQGSYATYHFSYGQVPHFSSDIPIPDGNVGSGDDPVTISHAIKELAPETAYHRRVVATNGEGVTSGSAVRFSTLAQTPSFLSSFGGAGTGTGQFNRPMGAATDANGNVYVVDRENHRVSKFNAKGEFLSSFGSLGSGNGQFNDPRSITVDPAGNLWVTDMGNDRVQQFTAAGTFIRQVGAGTLTAPYGIAVDGVGRVWVSDTNRIVEFKESSPGVFPYVGEVTSVGGSQLNLPAGLGLDPEGDVWVAEVGANRIWEIEGTGSGYTAQLRFGTAGSGQGQLSQPYDVKVKANGNLIVADRGNNRVQQFSQEGEFQAAFGGAGPGPGQFNEPSGVAVGLGGQIFVVDSGNKRVQRWGQPVKPEAITQSPTNVTTSSATLNGLVNPGSIATTYRFEYGMTPSYGTSIPVPNGSAGSGVERVAKSQLIPTQSETTYHYRIVAINSEGTTYGRDVRFTTPAKSISFLSAFGSAGSGPGQFNRPMGTAVDTSGNVYVVDRENHLVSKFNSKGEYLSQFGSFGSGNGQFKEPRSIAVAPNGHLWVTDFGNARVQEFNAAGEYIQQLSGGKLSAPYGIAVDGEGRVWVSDAHKIVEFKESSPGTFSFVGELNSIEGSPMGLPAGLGLDPEGDVWIAEANANRISEIEGTLSGYVGRLRFGTAGSGQGQLSQPYDVKVKSNGNLIVVDRGNNRVQQFSPSGEFQAAFGAKGTGSGLFTEPTGIAVAPGGVFYVTDSGNKRVQRWVSE